MSLEECILAAQAFVSDRPINESTTCDWVIRPLLLSIGYTQRDIESRVADSGGQFPDYTILPSEPAFTWYLEAKDWKVQLEDSHARQALNYANHNGKRFVVLTNGRQWRLYDNGIQGVIGEKLCAEAMVTDTMAVTELLSAVSKAEVMDGGLDQFSAEARECLKMRRAQKSIEFGGGESSNGRSLPQTVHKTMAPRSPTDNPSVAQVREFIIANYVEPARLEGTQNITIVARDIHKELGMVSAFPTVCNAVDSVDLHSRAGIKLINRTGPRLSSTVTWRFELI